MRRKTAAAVLAVAAIGVTGGYRLRQSRRAQAASPDQWHAVTVHRPLDEVAAHLPEELTRPTGAIEMRLTPAPGGRGTEIHARAAAGSVTAGDVRRALRVSRSRLEVGDVLRPGGPTTTPTVLNRALRATTRRGREEGLL